MRQAGQVEPAEQPSGDPVVERRRRIDALTRRGQRVGYLLYLLAAIGFFVGLATGYTSWLVTTIWVCLIAGSVVLAPAIVFAYAVKAADRADRDNDW
jgi:hypothetical protein